MNLQGLNMKSIIKSNLGQSLYSPNHQNAYPIKAKMPNSPNQSNNFILNIYQKKINCLF